VTREFEDTKEVVRSHKSKDIQYNDQEDKSLHRKVKIEQHESYLKQGAYLTCSTSDTRRETR